MILADELILRIRGDVPEFIGNARQRCVGRPLKTRMKACIHAKDADGQGVAVPSLFVGQAPIWRRPGDHVALRAIKRMSTATDCRGVIGNLGIKVVIQPYVNSEASHVLAESSGAAVDLGGCYRAGRDTAA